ncbi:MAG TPA: hypothetical protein PKM15_08610, partial [bacterium]|nr:hypothetical protein [bacterium]
SGLLIAGLSYDGIRAKIDTGNIDYLNSPEFMWMIYFALAIMSPVAVIALKKSLSQENIDEAPSSEPQTASQTEEAN